MHTHFPDFTSSLNELSLPISPLFRVSPDKHSSTTFSSNHLMLFSTFVFNSGKICDAGRVISEALVAGFPALLSRLQSSSGHVGFVVEMWLWDRLPIVLRLLLPIIIQKNAPY
jgi:hypothetical protein